MGSDQVTPPPGFTLDANPHQTETAPKPPPGFTLDAPPELTLMSKVGHGASELWNQINPIEGLKGASQAVAHPIDTVMADAGARQRVWDDAKKAFASGDNATGVAKALYALIPLLGPNMARSGDQFASGDIAGGIGSSVGQGLALAGPSAIGDINIPVPKRLLRGAAEKVAQNALKPPITTPPARVAQAVGSMLDNETLISPVGVEKLNAFLDKTQADVSNVINSTGPKRNMSPGPVSSNLDALANSYRMGGARSTIDATSSIADTEAVKNSLLDQLRPQGIPGGAVRNMTAQEAQAMKVSQGQQLRKSYGKVSDATTTAQKEVVRTLKDELNNQFPGILDQLNTREAGGLALEPLLERRVAQVANQPFTGGILPAVVGAAVHTITGSAPAAVAAGFMLKVFSDPMMKSRIAIGLNRASQGAITIPKASSMFGGYLDALGQAASADASAADPAGSPNQ